MSGLRAIIAALAVVVGPLVGMTRSGAAGERAFRAGQEWGFAGRPGDPKPTLVVVKVEALPEIGEVVHVSVRGVRIRNPRAPEGYVDALPHLPFSPDALRRSVTSLVADSVTLPSFEQGYDQWRRAKGGAFTISVREALDLAEQTLK
jgi:hypothetical protein